MKRVEGKDLGLGVAYMPDLGGQIFSLADPPADISVGERSGEFSGIVNDDEYLRGGIVQALYCLKNRLRFMEENLFHILLI
ncbi:hypothetical protein MASR2M79_04830 [Aminivibrio sp.]